MNVDSHLLQAVLDEPDQNAPRLVLADWLEQNGGEIQRARAELIRVQIALANLPPDSSERAQLELRGQALLRGYERDWLPFGWPWRRTPGKIEWNRGMIEGLQLRTFNPSRVSQALALLPSLRSLTVGGAVQDISLASLLQQPTLKRLQSLSLSYTAVSDAGLAAVTQLCSLKRLRLVGNHQINGNGLAHLAGLEDLQELSLMFCEGTTDVGFARAGVLGSLRELDISFTAISGSGLQGLIDWPQLESLNLTGCLGVGDADLLPISQMTQLKRLNLTSCVGLTDAGMAHLSGMTRLTSLALGGCIHLTDEGIASLGSLRNLRSLFLQSCRGLSDVGLRHLQRLSKLRTLSLSRTNVSASGVGLMARLPEIQTLWLWGCRKISRHAVDRLKQSFPQVMMMASF